MNNVAHGMTKMGIFIFIALDVRVKKIRHGAG